ncbi:hypothetical protein GCM10023196_037590 [Actinoallomurus vinaceus]|uniref:Uncharacterized protein n=1 Tax=Actinoallomurus vinaceus TaxID=1080074 RepID=A0ABP8UAX0_9ACTN
MSTATKEYRTHKPSGQVAPPLILLEGGEKAGKSFTTALFTGSERVGTAYWVEFGETTAEEYGAIPGADYEIVEHDGTFMDFYGALQWVYRKAAEAKAAGKKPVVLVVDSMSAEWELLRAWAANRAKGSRSNRAKLAADPNAEIVISHNLWNDANDRHAMIMSLFRTFPGIVVMIARGKVVTAFSDSGQPIEGKKDYRVEGQSQLGFLASCWIRVSRDEPAQIIGCRKVVGGIRPGVNPPKPLDQDWTLDWVVFDYLKYDHALAQPNNLVDPQPERTPEQIVDEAMLPGTSADRIAELADEARRYGYGAVVLPNEQGQDELMVHLLRRLWQVKRAVEPASDQQRERLDELFGKTDMDSDTDERLKFVRDAVGRPVDSVADLTYGEAVEALRVLELYVSKLASPDETEAGAA